MKRNKIINDLLSILLFITLAFTIYLYRTEIIDFLVDLIYPKKIVLQDINKYKVDYSFKVVNDTENFIINDRQDFLNVFYTVLNNGWKNFTFYCDNSYKDCQSDIDNYINGDKSIISSINNLVSPFNEYDSVSVTVDLKGKIDIDFVNNYSEEEIEIINEKLDQIINENITDNMTDYDKIKTLHDYIINNSKYDTKNDIYKHATGILLYGHGNCSAYTDTMALLLNRLKIPNYRIASDEHTWNLVYVDGSWKHIDLTWDDPVILNVKKDILTYDYFLIDTKKLLELDKDNHNFDFKVYQEALQE